MAYVGAVFGLEILPLVLQPPLSTGVGVLTGFLRVRLWLSLLAGLFFGPLQASGLSFRPAPHLHTALPFSTARHTRHRRRKR